MKRERKIQVELKGKSFYCIFLLLLFTVQLFAQPLPSGGGLKIDNLFNNKRERIDIVSDSSVQIRNFVLEGQKVLEIFPATLSLPSVNIYSNQRMYIVYKKQAMVIDFIGVIRPNYEYNIDRMDSLVFQNGYFKYYINKRSNITAKGLTLQNKKQLIREGVLEHNRMIDFSFLLGQSSPALCHFKQAAYYLEKNQKEFALAELNKGIKKNKDPENCEIIYLLCDIYTKTEQYEKAVKNISMAININCKRNSKHEDFINKNVNYKTRIELFIKLKEYDKALEDYNSLFSISKNKIKGNNERANFKIKFLKDYIGVINDLKSIIDATNNSPLNINPLIEDDYSDTYFTLALAEYLNNDKKLAFRHWLKAEEFEHREENFNSHFNSRLIHYDSIIKQNPKTPDLFLTRALVNYNWGDCLRSSKGNNLTIAEDMKKCFTSALNDINKAEELGMQDYKINLHRASVLNQLKEYDKAMKEIDKAISKNNLDPRCFLIRYFIRQNLGQVKSDYQNDTDYKQYKMLSNNWKWEKY